MQLSIIILITLQGIVRPTPIQVKNKENLVEAMMPPFIEIGWLSKEFE